MKLGATYFARKADASNAESSGIWPKRDPGRLAEAKNEHGRQ